MSLTQTTQRAVQLVGPDQLALNESKSIPAPGPHQVLCKVEVVGLCFSDLKLLKQFTGHVRKSEVVAGLDKGVLAEIPSYVPGDKPTVPGHETVVRVIAAGNEVKQAKVGDRFLVQTDYRWLPTANSSSAFGYNFEGALQEYVLMDERAITSPDGESMLIPVPDDFSASAIALCEPWACVEDSYVERQRQCIKRRGQMLVVADVKVKKRECLQSLFRRYGKPGKVTWAKAADLATIKDAGFDDVIYFGANAETVEKLFPKVAPNGLFNIVQCGAKFSKPVVSQVGRVHYGAIRVIGTTGNDPADSMNTIPCTTEVRAGETVNVIGAGGPMGMMHVIRDLSLGLDGVTVYAGDLNDERLGVLQRICGPVAEQNGATLHPYNPQKNQPAGPFSYIVIMAPVPALVVQSIPTAGYRAIINIFAGIPADKTAAIDLDTYIAKQMYFLGTSGSTLDDMKAVLAKVLSRRLDTNLSVAAISGLEGAIDGIRAVEKNLMPGKIMVYPDCKGLKLTPINPPWSKQSEETLLAQHKKS